MATGIALKNSSKAKGQEKICNTSTNCEVIDAGYEHVLSNWKAYERLS